MKPILIAFVLLPVVALADGYYSSGSRGYYSNDIRTDRYGTSEAGRVQRAEGGRVVGIREVVVTRDNTARGSVSGAVVGGVIGHSVSSGRNRGTSTALGALLGALIGSGVERRSTAQYGHEVVVRLDNGRLIAITQGADAFVRTGDRVYVLTDSRGYNRIIRA